MIVRIFTFGIVREMTGGPELRLEWEGPLTVAVLRKRLEDLYPALRQLTTLAIAVNTEYAGPDTPIREGDEVALIPPVSGG